MDWTCDWRHCEPYAYDPEAPLCGAPAAVLVVRPGDSDFGLCAEHVAPWRSLYGLDYPIRVLP